MFFKCLLSGGKSSLSCWHRSKPYSRHSPPHRSMTYHVKEREWPHEFRILPPDKTTRYGMIFGRRGIVDILSKMFGREDAINRIYNVKTSGLKFAQGGAMMTIREGEQLSRVPRVLAVRLDIRRLAKGFAFEELKERDDEKALSIIHRRGKFFCGNIVDDSPCCSHCVHSTLQEFVTLSDIQWSSSLWTILMYGFSGFPMKVEAVDEFIRVLTQLLGCEVDSRMRIHSVATRNYYYPGFTAYVPSSYDLTKIDLPDLPDGVRMVIPGAQPIVKAPEGWGRM